MRHNEYIKEVSGADTAVLFIHGFLGSPRHFDRFIELLPENVSIYNVLLEGHGGSVSDFSKASMKKWKNQIRDVMDKLAEKYSNIYITAHSMGTFFAVEEAIRNRKRVRGIFLLQAPLKIGVKPVAFLNTFKSFFNIFGEDETGIAYKNAHSIKLTMRVWEYAGWIPRYMELFGESKRARGVISRLDTPCVIFQSKKDELVSMKSLKYIPDKCNIELNILESSAHFIYDRNEIGIIEKRLIEMIENN